MGRPVSLDDARAVFEMQQGPKVSRGSDEGELLREIERLRAIIMRDHKILRAHFDQDTPMTMAARSAGMSSLVAEARVLIDMYPEAKNWLELTFTDDIGKIHLVIQRDEGERPTTMVNRLKAELEAERAKRCGTCEHWAIERTNYRDLGVDHFQCDGLKSLHDVGCGDFIPITPPHFVCGDWEERSS